MKKILAMALIVTTVLSVVACGGKKTVGDNVTTPTNMENSTQEPTNAEKSTATVDSTTNPTGSVTATVKPETTTTPIPTVKPVATSTPIVTVNPTNTPSTTATARPTAVPMITVKPTAEPTLTVKPTTAPTATPNPYRNVKVGDYIQFGSYEQDNKTANGKENIEWLVLDIKNGKALVISKYALDAKPYHTLDYYTFWETCTLRAWLNNDFFNSAFSNLEKAMIPTVTVTADENVYEMTSQGDDTQDKVFLLSIPEISYVSAANATACIATDYAKAKGVSIYKGNCYYWLRTLGEERCRATYIDTDGDVWAKGGAIDAEIYGVRPAMWIDIT